MWRGHIKSYLLKALETRKTAAGLAAEFKVQEDLAMKWLTQAMEDGEVKKARKRKAAQGAVEYVRIVKARQEGFLP